MRRAITGGAPVQIERLNCHSSDVEVVSNWTFYAWGERHPEKTFEAWVKETRADCGLGGIPSVFVARANGRPIGTASLTADDMRHRPELGPWLASVFVLPAWRGRGIASAMVNRVEAEAREASLARLYLYTPDQQALYARLGWQTMESLSYLGEVVTLMQREI